MKSYREATLEQVKSKKKVERTVPIYLEDAPLEELKKAETKLLRTVDDKEKEELEAECERLKNEVNEKTVFMVFRSIGSKAYDKLLADNPPTDAQKAEHGEGLIWNPETFPARLIAASAFKPALSLEDVEELLDTWNGTEVSDLFLAALGSNTSSSVAEVGKGF